MDAAIRIVDLNALAVGMLVRKHPGAAPCLRLARIIHNRYGSPEEGRKLDLRFDTMPGTYSMYKGWQPGDTLNETYARVAIHGDGSLVSLGDVCIRVWRFLAAPGHVTLVRIEDVPIGTKLNLDDGSSYGFALRQINKNGGSVELIFDNGGGPRAAGQLRKVDPRTGDEFFVGYERAFPSETWALRNDRGLFLEDDDIMTYEP